MPRHYHSYSDLPKSLPLFPLTGAVLLPRGALPLNIFEPRYLEMVDYALTGDRLIGMIQPTEHEDTTLKPKLSQVGCVGKITSFQETDDNRYLITLSGICRFRLTGEMEAATPWRAGFCDFAPFAGDLAQAGDEDFPRDRLLAALKTYLSSRDMEAVYVHCGATWDDEMKRQQVRIERIAQLERTFNERNVNLISNTSEQQIFNSEPMVLRYREPSSSLEPDRREPPSGPTRT